MNGNAKEYIDKEAFLLELGIKDFRPALVMRAADRHTVKGILVTKDNDNEQI